MMNDDSLPIPDRGAGPGSDPIGPPETILPTAMGDGTADLTAVRALILTAYPDVVPDMVAGQSIADLLASVEGARAAFAVVADRVTTAALGSDPAAVDVDGKGDAVVAKLPAIPAGGGATLPIDPDRLPTSEKIRRGLRATAR